MARPRKLPQDDRYIEESLNLEEPRSLAEYPEEEEGFRELGLSSAERFAALTEADFRGHDA